MRDAHDAAGAQALNAVIRMVRDVEVVRRPFLEALESAKCHVLNGE